MIVSVNIAAEFDNEIHLSRLSGNRFEAEVRIFTKAGFEQASLALVEVHPSPSSSQTISYELEAQNFAEALAQAFRQYKGLHPFQEGVLWCADEAHEIDFMAVGCELNNFILKCSPDFVPVIKTQPGVAQVKAKQRHAVLYDVDALITLTPEAANPQNVEAVLTRIAEAYRRSLSD